MSTIRVTKADTLPPFRDISRCAKCASDDVSTVYKKGCGVNDCPDHAEFLMRTCQRCHYQWPEATVEKPSYQQGET